MSLSEIRVIKTLRYWVCCYSLSYATAEVALTPRKLSFATWNLHSILYLLFCSVLLSSGDLGFSFIGSFSSAKTWCSVILHTVRNWPALTGRESLNHMFLLNLLTLLTLLTSRIALPGYLVMVIIGALI